MHINTKKLKNGFELPIFGFGTWAVGGREIRDSRNDDKADVHAIKAAIELGITHIDTAEMYADGHAEELVAEAIKGFDRTDLIIVSKVLPEHLHYDDLINSAMKSLKRLKNDYIDIYLIHSPNPSIDIKETMEAMDHLVEKKYIRNIDHLKENLGALNWKMEKSDIELLMKLFPEIAGSV